MRTGGTTIMACTFTNFDARSGYSVHFEYSAMGGIEMRYAACFLLILTISQLATTQQAGSLDSRLSDSLARMRDQDLNNREDGFRETMKLISEDQHGGSSTQIDLLKTFFMRHPDKADSVELSLIRLLTAEDDVFMKARPGTHTEGDGEYYADLISAVSSLGDARAIPALIGAMTTGGIAQHALDDYGDQALEPVLQQLKSPDPLRRAVATTLGIHILRRHKDPASRERIIGIIMSSLADPNFVVRTSGVEEIECLEQHQQFVPVLKQLAKTDPAKSPGKALDGGDGGEFYPVRYTARRVLREMQGDTTCAPD
jgi:hypothetical protein